MFERITDQLMKEYNSLCKRMEEGKKLIESLDEQDEKYHQFVKHYNYLKAMTTRAGACIDILAGDVDLIAEYAGNLIVVKKMDSEKMMQLLEEAKKLGGFISNLKTEDD